MHTPPEIAGHEQVEAQQRARRLTQEHRAMSREELEAAYEDNKGNILGFPYPFLEAARRWVEG